MGEYYVIRTGSSEELYHHGIKGMKWGVRRFQKKDGSLTPAGKKRYDDDGANNSSSKKKKTTHRERLEANFIAKGLSPQEAKKAADKKIKIEKTFAIMAGVTVAACAAYYAKNKYIADRTDQILKAGTTFHNLDNRANYRPGEHLYVNYRQNDRNFFNGKFALGKLARNGHVFEHRIEAIDDVKIPSLKTRQSVFKQLYDNDIEFRSAMTRHAGGGGSAKKVYKNMWQKFGDKDTPYFNDAKAKYFKALKERGYNAIVDEWDSNAFVYRSDAPLILLNTNDKVFGKMTIKELKAKDILVAQANSANFKFKNDMLNAVYAPHANKFKESNRELAKYAKRNAKNRSYIETALFKEKYKDGLFNRNDNSKQYAFDEKGRELAYVGKYLSKNKNMTLEDAKLFGELKSNLRDLAESVTWLTTTAVAPYAVTSKAIQNRQVAKYRETHPNSKKTDAEIIKLLNK